MKKIYDKGVNIWPTQVIKDNLAFVIDPYADIFSDSVKYHICIVKDNRYAIPVATLILTYYEDYSQPYKVTRLSNPHGVISEEGKYLVDGKFFDYIDTIFDTIDMCINEDSYKEAIRQNI